MLGSSQIFCMLRPPQKADRKAILVSLMGGKCSNPDCILKPVADKLTPNCFDFHHKDPQTKSFTIGNCSTHSWERILKEAEKCDMLCVVCHRILHAAEDKLTRQLRRSGVSLRGYRERIKRGLNHDEAVSNTLRPGKTWRPKDVLTIDNITKPVKEWCEIFGINYRTFKTRTYQRGWDPVRALKQSTTEVNRIAIEGITKPISEWCAIYGISRAGYRRRLSRGFSPEQAITIPKERQ